MQELTLDEMNMVSGGIAPVWLLVGALILAALGVEVHCGVNPQGDVQCAFGK